MTFESKWKLQDRVHIDDDTSIRGIVTGLQFRKTNEPLVAISYIHNGDAKEVWIEEYRLSAA